MCAADKHGFLLVSCGRRFLIANLCAERSDLDLPCLSGAGTVS